MISTTNKQLVAYVAPFAAFALFIALGQGLGFILPKDGPVWMKEPMYLLYPLQTVVCGAVLVMYWKHYTFTPLRPWFWGVIAGLIALAIWVSPQAVFGFAPRTEGFDPEALGTEGAGYTLNVVARFARLVIVVPLLEEIFWRGFLMRYLIKEDFSSVAFGTYKPMAFFGTALGFMLVHNPPDYPAAFITGLIYNAVAVKTKSLFACVVAHAVTNALLGVYILATRQWGFW